LLSRRGHTAHRNPENDLELEQFESTAPARCIDGTGDAWRRRRTERDDLKNANHRRLRARRATLGVKVQRQSSGPSPRGSYEVHHQESRLLPTDEVTQRGHDNGRAFYLALTSGAPRQSIVQGGALRAISTARSHEFVRDSDNAG
jgi:hypothetical protein